MIEFKQFEGLVPATHTPFTADGSQLNVDRIETQCQFLLEQGVEGVFIAGSTGEFAALTHEEMQLVTSRWVEVARGTDMRVIAHVGGTQFDQVKERAKQAQAAGVDAIGLVAPYYPAIGDVEALVRWCEGVMGAASETPAYYYHIPSLSNTGPTVTAYDFLREANPRIDNLVGVKFTHDAFDELRRCVQLHDSGRHFDILFGRDEMLLSGLQMGATGAVGSTYNIAPRLYNEILTLFAAGEIDKAARLQEKALEMVRLLLDHGIVAAQKAIMAMHGVDCGPVRMPFANYKPEALDALRQALDGFGFFEMAVVGG